MIDSRQKGARAEKAAKDILVAKTGLNWQRVPASGALDAKHGLKGDLYIPDAKNIYCIEVKHYKDDQISAKLLTNPNSTFYSWWNQTVREATQVGRKPLLIFKYDRSKFFVANTEPGITQLNKIKVKNINIYLLEDWLSKTDRGTFICQ